MNETLNRREFLRTSALFAAGTIFAPLLLSARPAAQKPNMLVIYTDDFVDMGNFATLSLS